MNKPIQYLLVGFPFSGKTTLSKLLKQKIKYKRVNIDEIKEEFGIGNVNDDRITDETWKKSLKKYIEKL